mmetsp:Transcript_17310/g.44089  ORF Transcript_17310/g.44089 Transcript_17310/m.44089 type:complete len:143 (-) Transcript_17310:38-466(-)
MGETWISEHQKIGVLLTVCGLVFTLFGMLLLFDRVLMALGNLLFLCGILFLIGPWKTIVFFRQGNNILGSICFLGGVLLVVVGWPFIGIIAETYGFLKLFGGFLPYVIMSMRQIPLFGYLLRLPGISQLCDYIMASSKGLPV